MPAIGQKHASEEGGTNTKDPPSNWWLIIPTLAIAVATAVQVWIYCRQAEYARRGLRISIRQARIAHRTALAAKASADAAQESADAAHDSVVATNKSFIATHRPKLTTRFFFVPNGVGRGIVPIIGNFLVFNTGESQAILRRSYSEVVFADNLPARSAAYVIGEGATDVTQALAPGESRALDFPTNVPEEYTFKEYSGIHNRQDAAEKDPIRQKNWPWDNLFIVGWIEYMDEAGRSRKAGFCRKYDFVTKRFEVEEDPDYQYED